ncbi:MAG: AgmX/PglI C-terminal domain-containing protein [Deltaproteobacteria bacterium]|nr:AgmX/PglI C-terminal domain-containing protein [Deltaproteobacteria bacterium]
MILRDVLVEERLFLDVDRLPVTVGQSLRCRLSIPADGVPLERVLFVVDEGRFVLDGKVVEHGARGKLRLGEATILYQELAAPPVAARPRLPASLRGTLLDRVDKRLAVVLGASLLVHLGLGVGAWVIGDPEREPVTFQDEEQTFTAITYADPVAIELPPEKRTEPLATEATEATEATGVAKPVAPEIQTPRAIVDPPRPALATAEQGKRLAELLTTSEETPRGPGTMGPRRPAVDLDRQAKEALANGERTTLGNPDRASRTDDTSRLGTTERTVVAQPAELARTHKTAEKDAGRIDIRPDPTPRDPRPPTLRPDDVLAKIRGGYMTAIQRCYLKELRDQPTLAGKVTLVLTVDERGRVDNASASGVSPGVSGCIEGLMSGWRFAIPRDPAGEPTDASFRFSLQLTPI